MNFVKPPEFNVGDSWPLYEERLKRFFVAYGIEEAEDERRAAFLLTAVSMEVYQIVKNLCFPKLPEEKKFSEVCDLLKQRFTPTLVVFRERARFFEARQGDAESIMEWSTRLKKLAANCDFGEDLDVFIKNLFVVGLRRGPLFERVCEEEATASFDVLMKIALKKESTLQQRGVLDVHKIQQVIHGVSPAEEVITISGNANTRVTCASFVIRRDILPRCVPLRSRSNQRRRRSRVDRSEAPGSAI